MIEILVKSGDKVDTQWCHIFGDSPYTSHPNLPHIWNNDKNMLCKPHLNTQHTKIYDDHDAKMVPINWVAGPDKNFQTIFHTQERYMVTTLVLITSWSHQIKFAGPKLSYNISHIF